MLTNAWKYTSLLLFSIFLMVGMNSCVDDNFNIEENNTLFNDSDEGGLMFAIELTRGGFDVSGTTHDSKLSDFDEEIVVNPDNFQIVLFKEDGTFLGKWDNQEITEFTEDDTDFDTRKKYYVKIPMSELNKDPNVINHIRGNNFKIAVFANWAEYPQFTTTRQLDEDNNVDKNNIFYITHWKEDASYKSSAGNDTQGDDSQVLRFITGKGFKMGMFQDWLAIRFADDTKAEEAIRANYDVNNAIFHSNTKPVLTNDQGVKVTFTDMKDYDYEDVWQIWNFGGEANLNKSLCYNSTDSQIQRDWANINKDWYDILYPYKNTNNPNNGIFITEDITCRGLTIAGNSDTSNQNANVPYSLAGGEKAILIHKSDPTKRTNSDQNTFNPEGGNYLHFKVPADGFLYIKCQSQSGNARVVVRKGEFGSTGKDVYVHEEQVGTNLSSIYFSYEKDKGETVRVTGQPADLVIYSLDNDLIIYEVDYIKSHMVQSVDRQMINPANTPEGGISMYGIQDFQAVTPEVWPEGSTFNLSRRLTTSTGSGLDDYKYRTISLLRSVAKVEVLLPVSIFSEPKHMFLRTFNRFSRSAPMDVFTPTDLIWNGYSSSQGYPDKVYGWDFKSTNKNVEHNYSTIVGVDREIENIKTYGFTYNKNNNSNNTTLDYQNKIAWLFGLWQQEYKWDWDNNNNITIQDPNPYPRIFNTRINRSDFAHMIDGGKVSLSENGVIEGNDYYYYYAYVPEKNVTDPNDNASMSESPKVIRIEMRFGTSTDTNLDDNASYRIYFTTGGAGGSTPDRDSYDNLWENGGEEGSTSLTNLKSIYPVMRNHLYRFKVTGIRMNNLDVDFEVKGPDHKEINYTFN